MNKSEAISKLESLVGQIHSLKTLTRYGFEYKRWQRDTEVAIRRTFGEDSRNVKDFDRVWNGPIFVTNNTPDSYFQERYIKGLENSRAMLESMVNEVKEY